MNGHDDLCFCVLCLPPVEKCCLCPAEAVGHADGEPYYAQCYQTRPSIADFVSKLRPLDDAELGKRFLEV